jgi:hypothetical protein
MIKLGFVIGAALALSACGASRSGEGAPAPGQAPVPVVAPSPTGSAAPAPSSPPVASPPGSPKASVDPCPVSERTLLKALAGADAGRRGGSPTKLTGIKCYKGYAMARDGGPPGPGERAYFLFGFRQPQNAWIPLNAGTADVCDRYVLDRSIREHLGDACFEG